MGLFYRQLDDVDRVTIQTQLQMGWRPAAIASGLQRARSTITRELKRNGWKRASESSGQSRRWGNGAMLHAVRGSEHGKHIQGSGLDFSPF